MSAVDSTILPPEEDDADRELFDRIVEGFGQTEASDFASQPAKLLLPNGEEYRLPPSAANVLRDVAKAMMAGRAITIAPSDTMLTTSQAADMLNISRPTLIRLLEDGAIPFQMAGTHRRILLRDVTEYRIKQRARTNEALEELVRISQDAGLYDEDAVGEILD